MTCSFADSGAPAMRSAPDVSILRFLVVGYVALLPYLFEIGPRLNFAPADCFLVLVLVLAAAHLKLRMIGMDHMARWNPAHFRPRLPSRRSGLR